MSQHASLRVDPTRVRHRNVLKRHERIRRLKEQEKWNERRSVFGLPKVKSMKIKMKKIKAEKTAAETSAAGTAPAAPETPGSGKPTPKTPKA